LNQLKREIDKNYHLFTSKWVSDFESTRNFLYENHKKYFIDSYCIIASIQAWRTELLENIILGGPLSFYFEAQNDAVMSHVLAGQGCWRPSLQSLRSCFENVLQCLYYMDHHVELCLWEQYKHRLSVKELLVYINSHPCLNENVKELAQSSLSILSNEYKQLCLAVHGSSRSFRMTADPNQTVLCNTDIANIGGWFTRLKNVIIGINLLLILFFNEHLTGTRLPNLRKVISFTIPDNKYQDVRSLCKVRLYKKPQTVTT